LPGVAHLLPFLTKRCLFFCESTFAGNREAIVKRTLISVSRRFVLVAAVLSSVSELHAAIYEVGPGQPYASVQACLNIVRAGDTCNVHAGTYTEQLILTTSGTSGNPITVKRNGTDVVTVQNATTPVVNLSGKNYYIFDGVNVTYNGSNSDPRGFQNLHGIFIDYIQVQNLTVTMASGSGTEGSCIYIADGDHVTVNNVVCAVTASGGVGMGIDGMDFLYNSNLTLTNNTIYGNASTSTGRLEDGIVVNGSNIVIENNVVRDGWAYDTHPDGIVIQGGGDRFGGNTRNVTVSRNTVINFTQGIYFDCIFTPISGSNLIANNVIYEKAYTYGSMSPAMSAIVLDGEALGGAAGYPISAGIYNNTIDSHLLGVYTARLVPGNNIAIKNNIRLNPRYGGFLMATLPEGHIVDYNYYSGGDNQPIVWGGTPFTLQIFKSATGQELNSRTGTVSLNPDYTVTGSSDSLGRGLNISTTFTTDRAGITRPSGTVPWDMGAYVFAGINETAPAPPTGLKVQ
jgi:hypothetical protein